MKVNASGKILIASPTMPSLVFSKTVIYIYNHDEYGAVGVALNAPMDPDMAQSWSKELSWPDPAKIFHGGPVDRRLGYVIHSPEYNHHDVTTEINSDLSYTNGRDIIRDINRGQGPDHYALMVGYCAWESGQLDAEIDARYWMVVDYDLQYFFNDITSKEQGWKKLINLAAENETDVLLTGLESSE